MTHEHILECNKCNAKLKVIVTSMNVPGGKETEEGYCPKCNNLVARERTSGFVNVVEISEKSE